MSSVVRFPDHRVRTNADACGRDPDDAGAVVIVLPTIRIERFAVEMSGRQQGKTNRLRREEAMRRYDDDVERAGFGRPMRPGRRRRHYAEEE